MKAIQITAPETVIDVEVNEPQEVPPGHLKVAVKVSSICNQHESKIFHDRYCGAQKVSYPGDPGFPGHEGAGLVVAVGEGVSSHAPGDKVLLNGYCGHLHAGFVVCPAERAPLLAPSVALKDAAPAELFACALQLCRRGDFINREHVVINGLGPAGMAFIQWLKVFGAARITAVDLVVERLEMAEKAGVNRTIPAADTAALEALAGEKPATVIECSGTHAGFQMAFQTAAKEALIMGYNDEPFMANQADWFHRGLTIKQTYIFDNDTWHETARYLNHGLIQPGWLVSHLLPLGADSYRTAMQLIRDGSACKIVLEH